MAKLIQVTPSTVDEHFNITWDFMRCYARILKHSHLALRERERGHMYKMVLRSLRISPWKHFGDKHVLDLISLMEFVILMYEVVQRVMWSSPRSLAILATFPKRKVEAWLRHVWLFIELSPLQIWEKIAYILSNSTIDVPFTRYYARILKA